MFRRWFIGILLGLGWVPNMMADPVRGYPVGEGGPVGSPGRDGKDGP